MQTYKLKSKSYCTGSFLTFKFSQTPKPVIIVSKKISNKAVIRNRLRRQIRELLRQHHMGSGIVRIVRLPDLDQSFDLLERDIVQCSRKL